MVGTRHSLPSTAADDAAPEDADPKTSGMSKKAQAALKKLQIDGKGALVGDKTQQEEFETYHFRGAVYAVSKDTKKEWIEAEPERYRRRKARRESGTGSLEEEREDSGYGRSSEDVGSRRDTPVESGTGGRRVRFGSVGGREDEAVSKKRKRSIGNDMEDAEDDQSRKRRRSIGARKSAHPSSSPRGARQARMPSPAGPQWKKQTAKSKTCFPPHASPTLATNPYTNDPSIATSIDKMVTTRSNGRDARDEQLRETQRNLLNVVRMNEQYEKLKDGLKKIFLRSRLRELRHGGGNQLSTMPDPNNLPPRPAQPQSQDPQAGVNDTTPNPPIDPEASSNESSVDLTLPAPAPARTRPFTSLTNTNPSTFRFSLNDHLTNPSRAECALFATRRTSATGQESRSTRRRRVNREMDAVRNSWAVEEAPVNPSRDVEGEDEGDFVEVVEDAATRLQIPRPGVPEGAPYAHLPDEVRGRMDLFSEEQRREVRDAYFGQWSPPRPDAE